MKKTLKMLMVALLIIPCAIVLVACKGTNNPDTPPNYEAVAKKHTLNTYSIHATLGTGTEGYFESTDNEFDAIIEEYLLALNEYYETVLELDEYDDAYYYLVSADENELDAAFDEFNENYNFELVPGTDSKFTGAVNIYANSTAENPIDGYEDLPFTISESNGTMTITGDPFYENEYTEYKYNNGTISVEIDAAQIIKDLIEEYNSDALSVISNGKIAQVPELWVQFELN